MESEVRGVIGHGGSPLAAESARARSQLAELGVERDVIHAIDVALEELVTNTLRHGRGTGARRVSWCLKVSASRVELALEDELETFDPFGRPLPPPMVDLETEVAGGRGLAMVRALVQDLRHERTSSGNRLVLTVPRARR